MIIVFGSLNTDISFDVSHFPARGETVTGETYRMSYGGKGANQALAASRMGAKTVLIGCVGNDGMGMRIRNGMKREGVLVSGVAESETLPTGIAMVTCEKGGENNIMVAIGANAEIHNDQVPDEILRTGAVLLMQMEVPPEQVFAMIERGHENGVRVMLNLAPAKKITSATLMKVDDLILNEIEAQQLAKQFGVPEDTAPQKLSAALAKKFELHCIITCASKGVYATNPDGAAIHIPALAIEEVVDTTGAGDAFCGTYAACIHNGKSFIESLKYACVAGSLTCTKMGVQDALPFLGDIRDNIDRLRDA